MTGTRTESIRVMHPLFREGEGGSTPTSVLQLRVDRVPFEVARDLNALWHSRLPRIGDPPRLMRAALCYAAHHGGVIFAVAIWSHPVALSLPQREWLELRRLAVAPDAPRNTASRVLAVMARLIRRERPGVVRLISYQDTEVHRGTIYRAAGWTAAAEVTPFARWDKPGRPRPPEQSRAPKRRWERPL